MAEKPTQWGAQEKGTNYLFCTARILDHLKVVHRLPKIIDCVMNEYRTPCQVTYLLSQRCRPVAHNLLGLTIETLIGAGY